MHIAARSKLSPEWTRHNPEELLDLFQAYPSLYDTKCELYRNRVQKAMGLARIEWPFWGNSWKTRNFGRHVPEITFWCMGVAYLKHVAQHVSGDMLRDISRNMSPSVWPAAEGRCRFRVFSIPPPTGYRVVSRACTPSPQCGEPRPAFV